jgi:hypothetical protein
MPKYRFTDKGIERESPGYSGCFLLAASILLAVLAYALLSGCAPIKCHDGYPFTWVGGGAYASCQGTCWKQEKIDRFSDRGIECGCSADCPCWRVHSEVVVRERRQ